MTKYWMFVWLIIGIAVGLLVPIKARGQSVCGERIDIIKNVERIYGEVSKHIALTADGKVLEVLVAPNGGWTIIITHTSGMACIMAVGEAWEDVPPVYSGPGT